MSGAMGPSSRRRKRHEDQADYCGGGCRRSDGGICDIQCRCLVVGLDSPCYEVTSMRGDGSREWLVGEARKGSFCNNRYHVDGAVCGLANTLAFAQVGCCAHCSGDSACVIKRLPGNLNGPDEG